MCTVTFLPIGNNDFILTSNRDVPYSRERALPPKEYVKDGVKLWYPKDGKAGGTWFGYSEHNRLICLLNGGFEYHTSRSYYRMSRGIIVKDLLLAGNFLSVVEEKNLVGVEPFTTVIVEWKSEIVLRQLVWDGREKHLVKLPLKPRIWSSATLYDSEVRKMREEWFKNWQQNNDFTPKDILKFHKTAGIGDPFIDVMMDRKVGGTVSITSFALLSGKIDTFYEGIITKT